MITNLKVCILVFYCNLKDLVDYARDTRNLVAQV